MRPEPHSLFCSPRLFQVYSCIMPGLPHGRELQEENPETFDIEVPKQTHRRTS